MKKGLLSLGSVLLMGSVSAQCVDEANVYEFTHGGKTYELIKENKTWADAAACAVSRGGTLAQIDSEEENAALFDAISTFDVIPGETIAPDGGGGSYLWIGATDKFEEGRWIWDVNNDDTGDAFWVGASDGIPVDGLYNNWGSSDFGSEPDDFGGIQDAAGLSVNGWPLGVASEWNDVSELNELFFYIEYAADGSGIEESSEENGITIYPNPVSTLLFVSFEATNPAEVISIFDMSGKVIGEYTSDFAQGIDVSTLTTGIYFVAIKLEDGTLITEKFTK